MAKLSQSHFATVAGKNHTGPILEVKHIRHLERSKCHSFVRYGGLIVLINIFKLCLKYCRTCPYILISINETKCWGESRGITASTDKWGEPAWSQSLIHRIIKPIHPNINSFSCEFLRIFPAKQWVKSTVYIRWQILIKSMKWQSEVSL